LLGATPLKDRSRTSALLERVYEIFPKLKERRSQARRHHVGRRAADARGRRALIERPKAADVG